MNDLTPDWPMLDRVIARTRHAVLREQVARDPAYWKVVRMLDGQPVPDPPKKPRVSLGTPHCVPCQQQKKQG